MSFFLADGKTIGNLEEMKEAAIALHAYGPQFVLVKVRESSYSTVVSQFVHYDYSINSRMDDLGGSTAMA